MGGGSSGGNSNPQPSGPSQLDEENRLRAINETGRQNELSRYYDYASQVTPSFGTGGKESLPDAQLNLEIANQYKNSVGGRFDVSPYQLKVQELSATPSPTFSLNYTPSFQGVGISPEFIAAENEKAAALQKQVAAQEQDRKTNFENQYQAYRKNTLSQVSNDPIAREDRLGLKGSADAERYALKVRQDLANQPVVMKAVAAQDAGGTALPLAALTGDKEEESDGPLQTNSVGRGTAKKSSSSQTNRV